MSDPNSPQFSSGNDPQEQYSLDEMMDRLKKGSSGEEGGEPELITRADGSQVMRKRRRKRRSDQPQKKEVEKKKKLLVLQLGSIFVVLFVLVMAVVFVFGKFNSKTFTEETEETVANWTKSKVRLKEFSVNPVAAQAKQVRLEWADDSFLSKAVFKELTADLKVTNLVANKWMGREVFAKEGTIAFKKALSNPEITSALAEDEIPYDYQRYRCGETSVLFGETKQTAPILIEGMETSLKYLGLDGFQLNANKGTLTAKGFGEFIVYRGTVSFRPGIIDITSFRLKDSSETGEAILSGSVPMNLQDRISLDLDLIDFPLSSLIGAKMGRIMDGHLNTEDGRVVFKHGDYDGLELKVPFSSPEISLSGLPFLQILKELMSESNYAKPIFIDEASGSLMKTINQSVVVSGLKLERKGLMYLKGGFTVSSTGQLSGQLTVGLSDTRLSIAERGMRANGNERPLPFGELEDGYRWMKLNLSGTVDNPQDNFESLLRDRHSEVPSETINPSESFEELTR